MKNKKIRERFYIYILHNLNKANRVPYPNIRQECRAKADVAYQVLLDITPEREKGKLKPFEILQTIAHDGE